MSDVPSTLPDAAGISRLLPDMPLVIWIVALALVIGLAGGLSATEMVALFNAGYGRALGEFALILLPSFALAAALSRQNIASEAAGRTTLLASPVAGAGMICPDTAYAALSPAAGPYKLSMAFGAYTGFKLLYPAGPLIVAAGLGSAVLNKTHPIELLVFGMALTVPVWVAGSIWARAISNPTPAAGNGMTADVPSRRLMVVFAPFLLMAGLLCVGALVGETGIGALDFLFLPKGALLSAAILALYQTPSQSRRACLDSSVRRSGSLLLVIGAASAFGAVVTHLFPIGDLVPEGRGVMTLLALFALTVVFKLAQGSSMATFAAVAPVAAPIVAASGVDPVLAVFSICLGSFIAILPNDSYYWLVRGDALDTEKTEGAAIRTLAGATVVQAALGMSLLLLWAAFTL